MAILKQKSTSNLKLDCRYLETRELCNNRNGIRRKRKRRDGRVSVDNEETHVLVMRWGDRPQPLRWREGGRVMSQRPRISLVRSRMSGAAAAGGSIRVTPRCREQQGGAAAESLKFFEADAVPARVNRLMLPKHCHRFSSAAFSCSNLSAYALLPRLATQLASVPAASACASPARRLLGSSCCPTPSLNAAPSTPSSVDLGPVPSVHMNRAIRYSQV